EGAGKEGCDQEDRGEKGHGQEGRHQEDCRQEGGDQGRYRRRPTVLRTITPCHADRRIISTPASGRPRAACRIALSQTPAHPLRAAMVPSMKELDLHNVVPVLQAGGVIAYPTEAVWGLGCDPGNEAAVLKLLALKQRPVEKGMILVAAEPAQLAGWVELQALAEERRQAVLDSWPGASTWIVPAGERAPRWITGQHSGIAVRVSAHPLVQALCRTWGGPLVSTSANLAGQP